MPLGDASATPCSLQVLQSQEIEGTNQGVHLLLVEDQETLLARTLSERVTCSEQAVVRRSIGALLFTSRFSIGPDWAGCACSEIRGMGQIESPQGGIWDDMDRPSLSQRSLALDIVAFALLRLARPPTLDFSGYNLWVQVAVELIYCFHFFQS